MQIEGYFGGLKFQHNFHGATKYSHIKLLTDSLRSHSI